jgi:hypothetical protein
MKAEQQLGDSRGEIDDLKAAWRSHFHNPRQTVSLLHRAGAIGLTAGGTLNISIDMLKDYPLSSVLLIGESEPQNPLFVQPMADIYLRIEHLWRPSNN